MGKKERTEKKEKPLEKMTTKELKDLALGLQGIHGVHGMNKTELVSAIKEVRGIADEKKEAAGDMRETKGKIQGLKEKRAQAIEAGDQKSMTILRRRIARLKKKTRKAA
jgi:predicted  nucleic acid-binding Zn-ribbon protein